MSLLTATCMMHLPASILTATSTPTPTSSNRAITYAYDGLQRLTGAQENPGASYAYAYDDAGNRTGVWVNGTRTVTQTFNAANQIGGLTYDDAGNLTDDGVATYAYDALNRMTLRSTTPYTYNGDGALVDDGATRYTQDLVAPLSQVLQTTQGATTTKYLYGLDRLAAVVGSTRTWYVGDALGSVRLTLDDAGTPLGVVSYDPWGTPESGAVPTFGFTGEVQSGGMVNLRARWYATAQGRFVTFRWRTSESNDLFPYTHHGYAYALGNPVLNTDASGQCSTSGQGDDYCHTDKGEMNYWRFDLTLPYMYQEMIRNAQSQTVQDIKALLDQARSPVPVWDPSAISSQSQCVIIVFEMFFLKVQANAVWDHKPILRGMLGLPDRGILRYFPIRGDTEHEFFFDIWSNIHFGFVGSAAGFDAATLHTPGDLAAKFSAGLPGIGRDNPGDKLNVQIGIELWNKYHLALTAEQLRQEILMHTQEFLLSSYKNKAIPKDDGQ